MLATLALPLCAFLPNGTHATAVLPDRREEVDDLVERYEDLIDDRGKHDEAAIALLGELEHEYARSGRRDRADLLDAVERTFRERRGTLPDGSFDDGLYLAAATTLGSMGPESADPLEDLIGKSGLRDNLRLQRELILSLGRTEVLKMVDTLTDLLTHHQPTLQAAAAEALAQFEGADGEVRKEAVKELVEALMYQQGQRDNDLAWNEEVRWRYDIIVGPITSTLQILTGHEEWDAHAWQRWWNKNKRSKWD